jgi:hypothetical protein
MEPDSIGMIAWVLLMSSALGIAFMIMIGVG